MGNLYLSDDFPERYQNIRGANGRGITLCPGILHSDTAMQGALYMDVENDLQMSYCMSRHATADWDWDDTNRWIRLSQVASDTAVFAEGVNNGSYFQGTLNLPDEPLDNKFIMWARHDYRPNFGFADGAVSAHPWGDLQRRNATWQKD